MSKIEVNTVEPQCGTTLTLGASGDTVTLGSGASQSGFGRTGTVDWQTTPKTANFTAVNGEGYFVNTTSSAVTMTMPSGSAGAIVSIQDYNKTFDTNALTITPASGEIINGGTADGDLTISTEGQGLTFVYVDSTVGWKTIHENEFTSSGSNFIIATGGTITTSGDFKIHTFNGPGTFTVCAVGSAPVNTVDYLVVAGGGGAGATPGNSGGGGGAGGFRYFASPSTNPQSGPGGPRNAPAGITVTATSFPITVGGGGAGGTAASPPAPGGVGTTGSNSIFSTITSAGGGGGGMGTPGSDSNHDGLNGGSGGGGGGGNNVSTAGTGNTPPVSPAQGTNGGANACGPGTPDHQSSGGGGALAAGQPMQGSTSGNGGAGGGLTGFGSGNGQCSSCVQYFAGGGGGGRNPPTNSSNTTGGLGGGGAPPGSGGATGGAGTANTGGGGGGGVGPNGNGGAGGSGIVVIRYKYQ